MKIRKQNDPGLDTPLHELETLWQQRDAHIDALLATPTALSQSFSPPARRRTPLGKRLWQSIPVLAAVASITLVVAFPDNYRSAAYVRIWTAVLMAASMAAVAMAHAKHLRLLPQAVTGSVVTFLLLLTTSCSSLGDGNIITQNTHDRAAAVGSITLILGPQS